jgi:putative oxidoreductase
MMLWSGLSRFEPDMRAVFRVVTGALFAMHGTMKVFNWPLGAQPMAPFDPMTQMGVAGILETVGGVAIILGLLTRPVAFILAGEMAVAFFQVHFPQTPFPALNGGEAAALYCFSWLYLLVAGPGSWSMDSVIAKSVSSRHIRSERRVYLRRQTDEREPVRVHA